MSHRDKQRARVYAWQARIAGYHGAPTWKSIDEVRAWAAPIWRSERGRYGRANVPAPLFESPHWGQRRAIAHHDHRITLPRWARRPSTVLHEMAHRLTPRDEAHGPRFVGVLIGLLCRHAGHDVDELMALADEMGVRYHVRSIGAVPVIPLSVKLLKLAPIGEMDAAIELDVHWRQVRGAALHLIRQGSARWYRGRLVAQRPG